MTRLQDTTRRTVLKILGAGFAGGTVLTGSATACGNVVSQINSSGHYAWFPLTQKYWGRQKHPYDFSDGDSRWMADPAPGGAVRLLARNLTTEETFPNRNTGFDIHMGPLGDLSEITVTSRTVRTQENSAATLVLALYLDENKNGEFFHWEKVKGDRESAKPGLGGDEEGIHLIDAGGVSTISDCTTFHLLKRDGSATFGELQAGDIAGIDGETPAALYIGVVDVDPETDGVEEAIIEEVDIQKK